VPQGKKIVAREACSRVSNKTRGNEKNETIRRFRCFPSFVDYKLTCLSRRSRGDKFGGRGRVRRRSQHRRTRSRQDDPLRFSLTASSRASFQHHSIYNVASRVKKSSSPPAPFLPSREFLSVLLKKKNNFLFLPFSKYTLNKLFLLSSFFSARARGPGASFCVRGSRPDERGRSARG